MQVMSHLTVCPYRLLTVENGYRLDRLCRFKENRCSSKSLEAETCIRGLEIRFNKCLSLLSSPLIPDH